ncbi:HlyD family secretion protein [Flavihumibacter petaseus]|uniref:Putative multidrug efflux pump membrane fusion protein n=1 Tax=Flavihumibacter petaseus NBRC 106054 TaxID=1220578 RepID=A0A0E9MVW2_9BACT|nr:HlyD family secretion protein [Flavihumibacter petaseus]GAO41270.1 putative multidrug efflux pump membrane fusion protein [Flavihumibacter petaseus NBRC 106054]
MSTQHQESAAHHGNSGPQKRNKTFIFVLAALVIAGGWFGISKYVHGKHHEETDDAQVEAHISPIIPRISGYVKEVRVKDNQVVKKGDTLLIIDDRDIQIRLAQAEAALATAQSNLVQAKALSGAANANIGTSRAALPTIDAQMETAKINVWRTTQDYNRYSNLIKDHSITQQQFEQAQAAKETAERQLQVLEQQRAQAAVQTHAVASQSNATAAQVGIAEAAIKQRQVDVEEAKLNLTYTVITAQEDGMLSKVNIQAGQFLNAGQQLFSLVLDQHTWIVANFKETQVDRIREGQKVIVHVDAFPEHDFEAKVSSFSPATGAKFALLPPDNSSGNFVKVVQRLPIRIDFSNAQDSLVTSLKAGMNVFVDVHLD